MTRLTSFDIEGIASSLERYDSELVNKCGFSLAQICAAAAGYDVSSNALSQCKVALLPITYGKGLIKGFSESVGAIISHLGARPFITRSYDVRGLAEAFASGAQILMLADDDCFTAINLISHKVVDNAAATARGYAVALDKMAGGLHNKNVLLLGAGRVGSEAAVALVELGANLIIFDIDKKAESTLVSKIKAKCNPLARGGFSLDEALGLCSILYDASPGLHYISSEQVNGATLVAAPGMPLGLSPDAEQKVSGGLIHDPLQIGVGTMLYQAIAR